MLEHGGNLRDAVRHFGRPFEDWIDLSTGINPHFYPAPQLTDHAWHRLPEYSDALVAAAQNYYGAPQMLAVAGTQAAIQALPRLRGDLSGFSEVTVSAPSYAEHAHQWRKGGHLVSECSYDALEEATLSADVVVLCNPNNPTGASIAPDVLLRWAAQLANRGGWLVVDEAFGDTVPALGVAAHTQMPGLIVLRSVGKFFGLAGIRLGFVAAPTALLQRLADFLGPWAISGPAQQITIAALHDQEWQQQTALRLQQEGQRLRLLLAANGMPSSGTDLFQWCSHASLGGQTDALWQFMAEQGIWLRRFAEAENRPHGLRFGLPGSEQAWVRLQQAFDDWRAVNP